MSQTRNTTELITVFAWLGAGMAGFGLCIHGLQLLMLNMGDGMAVLKGGMAEDPATAQMPGVIVWMFAHFEWLILLSAFGMILVLVSCLGIVWRKNWARLLMIGLLALSILGGIATVPVQIWLSGDVFNAMDSSITDSAGFQAMRWAAIIMSAVFMAAIAVGLGLLIWLLRKSAVRAEFVKRA